MAKDIQNLKVVSGQSLGSTNATIYKHNIKGSENVGVHLVWTGTPTGTLKIQGSCEDSLPVNWVDIPSQTIAAGGAAGNTIFFTNPCPYSWLNISFTYVSGSGSLDAWIVTKG